MLDLKSIFHKLICNKYLIYKYLMALFNLKKMTFHYNYPLKLLNKKIFYKLIQKYTNETQLF